MKGFKQYFRARSALLFISIVALLALASGCGGGAAAPIQPASTTSLSIVPSSASLYLSEVQRFQAVGAPSNGTLTWSVNGVAGGNSQVGTISADNFQGATYTPPGGLPSPATVQIAVSSSSSSVKSGSATVSLSFAAPVISAVSPSYALVGSLDTPISVGGKYFASATVLSVNGTPVATTVQDQNTLTATVPSSLLTAPADLDLTASTSGAPASGSLLHFTVLNQGQVSATQNPLVAMYSITLPRDAKVTVVFGPDTNYGLQTWTRPTPTGGGTVNILVAGMRASTTYHMRADVTFQDGTSYQDPDQTFTTGAVDPSLAPQVSVTQPGPLTPSPGVELMDMLLIPSNTPGITGAAYDLKGNLIWYYQYDPVEGWILPFKQLPNGDFLVMLYGNFLREIDLAGDTVWQLTADQLNTKLENAGYAGFASPGFSHDFAILPNGHVVVIISHNETISNLVGYTGPVQVTGDALVDLDQNLNPVWVWDTFDHLDVNHHPMNFPDWTHANAVAYSSDDGNLLFSMRHQHWIIKIDYEDGKGSGNILWRFGNQGDFTLDSGAPAAWQYGQHYIFFPKGTSSGEFEMATYDDGNNRVLDSNGDVCGTTGQPVCYSRAVVFDVNENTKTASVAWQDILPFYSAFLGSMQQLPNGDEEFGNGYISQSPLISSVEEVTRTDPPQMVWELTVAGRYTYRGLRIPSLYPGVQW